MPVVASLALAIAFWLSLGAGRVPPTRQVRAAPVWLAGRPGAVKLRLRLCVGAALGLAAWAALPILVGQGLATAVALASLPVSVVVLGRLEPAGVRRARERELVEAPQAMELLASCLSAGAPLRMAVAEVARLSGPEVASTLGRVASLVSVGVPDGDAWLDLADHPVWGRAARDVARSAGSGTAVSGLLAEHATSTRTLRRREVEQRARTVGVRSVGPLMCCFLPAFLLVGVVPLIAGTVFGMLG